MPVAFALLEEPLAASLVPAASLDKSDAALVLAAALDEPDAALWDDEGEAQPNKTTQAATASVTRANNVSLFISSTYTNTAECLSLAT